MSNYADSYKDCQKAKWLDEWVPETEEELGHTLTWEQYRFTLARARSVESRLKEIDQTVLHLKDLLFS